MEEPDPATVRAAAAGDVDAFVGLVRVHQAPVWRFLRHLVGDDALAEDLTQETFLRVHQRLRSFDGRSRFLDLAVPRGPQRRRRRAAGP